MDPTESWGIFSRTVQSFFYNLEISHHFGLQRVRTVRENEYGWDDQDDVSIRDFTKSVNDDSLADSLRQLDSVGAFNFSVNLINGFACCAIWIYTYIAMCCMRRRSFRFETAVGIMVMVVAAGQITGAGKDLEEETRQN